MYLHVEKKMFLDLFETMNSVTTTKNTRRFVELQCLLQGRQCWLKFSILIMIGLELDY